MSDSTPAEWPAELPEPLLSTVRSFDGQGQLTRMESGRLRHRRNASSALQLVRAQWNFVGDQFAAFQEFYQHDLQNGQNSFDILLSSDAGEEEDRLQFHGKFDVARSDNLFSVSALLQVLPRPPYDPVLCSISGVDSGDSFECYPVGWTGSMYGGETWSAEWSFASPVLVYGDDMQDYSVGEKPSNGGAGFADVWNELADIDADGEDFESYSVGASPSGGGSGFVGNWGVL